MISKNNLFQKQNLKMVFFINKLNLNLNKINIAMPYNLIRILQS